MARDGNPNIIAFDDAKRMASVYGQPPVRSRYAADDRAFAGAGEQRRAPRVPSWYEPADAARSVVRDVSDDARFSSQRASSHRSFDASDGRAAAAASARVDAFSRDIDFAVPDDDIFEQAAPRAALECYDPSGAKEGFYSSRLARREEGRAARAKRKAERLFFRQFGSDEPAEPTSRAALYKGEMGRSHRRAFSDLNNAAKSGSSSAAYSGARPSRLSRRFASPLIVAMLVIAFVIGSAAFLYPTARQYYVESREEARLQAEYDAIAARNHIIEERIDHLKTDEGIEDAARAELGWVHEGETAGIVQGLGQGISSAAIADIEAQVKSGSVPAPETWYSPFLDMVFGYVDPATVVPENTDVSNVSDVSAPVQEGRS